MQNAPCKAGIGSLGVTALNMNSKGFPELFCGVCVTMACRGSRYPQGDLGVAAWAGCGVGDCLIWR